MQESVDKNRPWLSSPHLLFVLAKLAKAGELQEQEIIEIVKGFKDAIGLAGAREIGFSRDPEQSYNPRAARVVLILLNDAKIRDLETILVALERAAQGDKYHGYLQSDSPQVVSASFLLDRLRHLHLENTKAVEEIFGVSLKISAAISEDFPGLSLLLSKAVERTQRFQIKRF